MPDYVTTLVGAGLDSFTNLYDIEITVPSIVSGTSVETNPDALKLRIGDFTPPEFSLAEYNLDYQTIQITRQAPKVQGIRKVNFNLRCDNQYRVYNTLLAWKQITVDVETGDVALEVFGPGGVINPEVAGQILVKPYFLSNDIGSIQDASSSVSSAADPYAWIFYDCVCTKVGEPRFIRGSANTIELAAEFLFTRIKQPAKLLNTTGR